MQRRPLNISAALAIAIERQVDDIIANAKTHCAQQYRGAARRDFPDPTMADLAAFAPPAELEDAEADRRREFRDALRFCSEDPVGESTPGQRLHIWQRLRSLFTARPFRA